MKKSTEFAQELVEFCYASPTAYHAVENTKKILEKKKFIQLFEEDKWNLKPGKKYYMTRNDSALVAFVMGSKKAEETGFRIVGAHTDSPCFRIKPAPEMVSEGKYLRLNTEVYGGPIVNTWMDRPLALAGRVVLKSKDVFKPKISLVNINKPVCIIPNISIHMNRNLNKGCELNQQKDTLPFLGVLTKKLEEDGLLLKAVAKALKTKVEQILDFDLYLYEFEKGSVIGLNNDLISSARIDDLGNVQAGIAALTEVTRPKHTCVMACFDNEEVGSMTRMGADSEMVASVLERIVLAQGGGREEYLRSLASSFIVSADGAHAVHPNQGEKCDPTSRPKINSGIAIKISANKSYTSDGHSVAVFSQICDKAGVKTQRFVNRSDMRGGSTIGPISSSHLDIASVDVGIPMLAMHSTRELCGVEDQYDMLKVLKAFYSA